VRNAPNIVNRTLKPQWVFVALALVAGLYMVFVTGPFQAPDEFNHFFRAYQISEGQFLGVRADGQVGGWLPESIINAGIPFYGVAFHPEVKIQSEVVNRLRREPFHANRKVFCDFPNTVIYFPLCYLPQALGIAAGRLCSLSALEMMYAGRLLSLLCWIGFVWLAITLTPMFKWVMVLMGLMPMALFLAASLSADTMINGSSILLMAMVLRAKFGGAKSMSWGTGVLIGGLCLAISIMKFVYCPLALLILLIPWKWYGGRKQKIAYCSSVIGAACLAVLLWGIETKAIYIPLNGSNLSEQFSLILAKPWRYMVVLWNTICAQWRVWVKSFTGVLGWFDTRLPRWIEWSYPLVLIEASLLDVGNGRSLRIWERSAMTVLCCLCWLLIATAQYLTWNRVGADVVEGLHQGRYLIPLAVPALLILRNSVTAGQESKFFAAAVTVYTTMVLFTTCFRIYGRYY
jgi:uncharacterized membrane protein